MAKYYAGLNKSQSSTMLKVVVVSVFVFWLLRREG